jgi:hypothetical protein
MREYKIDLSDPGESLEADSGENWNRHSEFLDYQNEYHVTREDDTKWKYTVDYSASRLKQRKPTNSVHLYFKPQIYIFSLFPYGCYLFRPSQ